LSDYLEHLKREAQEWSKFSREQREKQFWELESVRRYTGRVFADDEDKPWQIYFKEKYGFFERAVSIGAGDLFVEDMLIANHIVGQLDCIDISRDAMEKGLKKSSFKAQLQLEVQDCNYLDLAEKTYDLVLMHHALHHFVRLDHILKTVRHSMKDDGLLLVNEYVGESRFQWSKEKLALCQRIVETMPHHMRFDGWGRPFPLEVNLDEMKKHHPFEAAYSDLIPTKLCEYFEPIEARELGGLLHPLLHNRASRARSDDFSWLELLCVLDSLCTKLGLRQCYMFGVFRKRKPQAPDRENAP